MKNEFIYNIGFVVLSLIIIIILWNAPPESTKKVPFDDNHKAFYSMSRKEAERHCGECHGKAAGMPLPKKHPPKYRCLFCHKRKPTKR